MIRRPRLSKALPTLAFVALLTIGGAPAWAQSDVATYQGADRMQKLIEGAKKEGTFTIYTSATVDDMAVLPPPSRRSTASSRRSGARARRTSSSAHRRSARWPLRCRRFETNGAGDGGAAPRETAAGGQVAGSDDLIPAGHSPARRMDRRPGQIFTAAYNTGLVKKADLPKTYEDLSNPKWKGKLGIEAADSDWFAGDHHRVGRGEGTQALPRDRDQERPLGAQGPYAACQPGRFRRSAAVADHLSLQGRATEERRRADRLVRIAARGRTLAGHRHGAQGPPPQRRGPVHGMAADGRSGNPGQARLHPHQPQGQAAARGHDAEVRRPGEDARRAATSGTSSTRKSLPIRPADAGRGGEPAMGDKHTRPGAQPRLRPGPGRKIQPEDELGAPARDAARDQGQGSQARRRPAALTAAITSSRKTASPRRCTSTSRNMLRAARPQKHGHVNEAAFYILDGARLRDPRRRPLRLAGGRRRDRA